MSYQKRYYQWDQKEMLLPSPDVVIQKSIPKSSDYTVADKELVNMKNYMSSSNLAGTSRRSLNFKHHEFTVVGMENEYSK